MTTIAEDYARYAHEPDGYPARTGTLLGLIEVLLVAEEAEDEYLRQATLTQMAEVVAAHHAYFDELAARAAGEETA